MIYVGIVLAVYTATLAALVLLILAVNTLEKRQLEKKRDKGATQN